MRVAFTFAQGFVMRTAFNLSRFQKSVSHWYSKNGRDLPWRRTRDPYAILVSEFMLQQTQVATVIPYYEAWLRRFPDFHALAAASESEILHAWQGLGYYSRARNLRATARQISTEHGGECPTELDQLLALRGIGRYTAQAVLTFAHDKPLGIVEANTARLLARLFNVSAPIDSSAGRRIIWDHASRLVPQKRPGNFNSALIDLGATVCLARNPRCGLCPVKRFCRATDPLRLPIKKPRAAPISLVQQHSFILQRGRVLLQRCRKRWRGMWMLPELKRAPAQAKPIYRSSFPFTHHKVTLEVFRGSAPPGRRIDSQWFAAGSLDHIPLPSPHRRVLAALLPSGSAGSRARSADRTNRPSGL